MFLTHSCYRITLTEQFFTLFNASSITPTEGSEDFQEHYLKLLRASSAVFVVQAYRESAHGAYHRPFELLRGTLSSLRVPTAPVT